LPAPALTNQRRLHWSHDALRTAVIWHPVRDPWNDPAALALVHEADALAAWAALLRQQGFHRTAERAELEAQRMWEAMCAIRRDHSPC
jgi:hypothetical protein